MVFLIILVPLSRFGSNAHSGVHMAEADPWQRLLQLCLSQLWPLEATINNQSNSVSELDRVDPSLNQTAVEWVVIRYSSISHHPLTIITTFGDSKDHWRRLHTTLARQTHISDEHLYLTIYRHVIVNTAAKTDQARGGCCGRCSGTS